MLGVTQQLNSSTFEFQNQSGDSTNNSNPFDMGMGVRYSFDVGTGVRFSLMKGGGA